MYIDLLGSTDRGALTGKPLDAIYIYIYQQKGISLVDFYLFIYFKMDSWNRSSLILTPTYLPTYLPKFVLELESKVSHNLYMTN